MRIWDQVPPENQCPPHANGEWREIWGLFRIAERGFVGGYSQHPETLRWIGHEGALLNRMAALRRERLRRGLQAKLLPKVPYSGNTAPPPPWDDQLSALRAKSCDCRIPETPPAVPQ